MKSGGLISVVVGVALLFLAAPALAVQNRSASAFHHSIACCGNYLSGMRAWNQSPTAGQPPTERTSLLCASL